MSWTPRDETLQRVSLHVFSIAIVWFFAVIFIALTPRPNTRFPGAGQGRSSLRELLTNAAEIDRFVDHYGFTPLSLREAAAYAQLHRRNFFIYDTQGQRFDYLALTPSAWMVRSFGADGRASTLLTSEDILQVSASARRLHAVTYGGTSHGRHLFPPLLVEGTWNAERSYHASIYEHDVLRTRRLVVQDPANARTWMVASHPYVAEFYWLDPVTLIYSAGEHAPHQPGVFEWNLRENQTRRLTRPGSVAAPSPLATAGAGPAPNPVLLGFGDDRATVAWLSEHNPPPALLEHLAAGDDVWEYHFSTHSWHPAAAVSQLRLWPQQWKPDCDLPRPDVTFWCQTLAQGDVSAAVHHYSDFLEHWGDQASTHSHIVLWALLLGRLGREMGGPDGAELAVLQRELAQASLEKNLLTVWQRLLLREMLLPTP